MPPRQDDFAIHNLPDGRLIALVADGVSESPQSHLGSSIAIRQAANWLHTNLGPDITALDWTALLQHTAYALTASTQTLFNLPDPDPVRAEQELATTLVCAVIEPLEAGKLRAHLIGMGDSSAWILDNGTFHVLLGGKNPQGTAVASSAVTALPRVPTTIEPTVIEFTGHAVLLIGTDGIGDPLGDGTGAVGDLLRTTLTRPTPPSLIEFAHRRGLQPRSLRRRPNTDSGMAALLTVRSTP